MRTSIVLLVLLVLLGTPASAQDVLPSLTPAPQQFTAGTAGESGPPSWPQSPAAPPAAPNILVILTDDVGFGASSTFGGPIPTPTLDALAAQGLRYNQFSTTALCSPTRAALLTGRMPTNVGMGYANNLATGYSGYNSVIPKSAGTIAEILKQNGYSTAAFGKWHLTPVWEETQAGPFDRWPTGLGFEYFYGFLSADTSQWSPTLVENTLTLEPPHGDPNYILDRDLSDHAIKWVRQQHELAPEKPFFLYLATGAAHSPHHAPKEWLEGFRGKFDSGWDAIREQTFARQIAGGVIPADTKLTPRPSFLPAWSSLAADQKRLYARLFEAFAAQLAFADSQIGRVVESLRASGQLDNTLVVFIQGDNGASAEGGVQGELFEQAFINGLHDSFDYMLSRIDDIGGPSVYSHFPAVWAWAMDSPFQYYKQVASHFGGIRNGLVISWPSRIKDVGGLRQQFHSVADIMPTILEVTGIKAPSMLNGVPQKPLDGISMAYTLEQSKASSRRQILISAMFGNVGIYHEGWWAGTRPVKAPWDVFKASKTELDSQKWELYNVASDFSQAINLAPTHAAKLAQMQQLFWLEAARNNVLPIHDPSEGLAGRPSLAAGRNTFEYHAGITRIPDNAAPRTIGRSFTITADIYVPDTDAARGVLITHGGRFGGYAFYLQEGRPVFHYNALGERQYSVRATESLGSGRHRLTANFKIDRKVPGAGGTMELAIDGRAVGSGRIERTLPVRVSHSEGFDVGEDTITPINNDYSIAQSRFSGQLEQLTIALH